MSGPEHSNRPDGRDHDEDEFEVSSLRSGAGSPSSSSWAALVAPDHLARTRIRRIAIVLGCSLLALAVLVSAVPGTRESLLAFLGPKSPAPSTSIPPGEDLFALLPNPPGVEVTLDGHRLTRLPAPGDPSPLRLARGRHVFAWTSHDFPFMPQRCIVYVPWSVHDTCPLVSPQQLPTSIAVLYGEVIGVHDSVASLKTDQQHHLGLAIQDVLAASQSTAQVQSGERYTFYPPRDVPVTATQPLRASLSFQLVSAPQGYPEPCINDQADACRFPGQDCAELCTVARLPAAVTGGAPDVWVAAAMVNATTAYATLDGRTQGSDLGLVFGPQLVVLRITWDGATWHVTPIFGHDPGLPVTDDVACNPARVRVEESDWSFMLTDPPSGSKLQFISDANPADGCVALLDQAPGKDTPAVFLERFGVLLAVNDVAAGSQSGLPMADAGEQRLARQIAAQAGIHI